MSYIAKWLNYSLAIIIISSIIIIIIIKHLAKHLKTSYMYANIATKLAMCINRIERIIAVTTRGAHILLQKEFIQLQS